MILKRHELKTMSGAIHRAGVDPAHCCPKPHLDAETGQNYRLVHKPGGNVALIEKFGHKVEIKDGQVFVRVPLGEHGGDNLGIDPETRKIVCLHCRGVK